MNTSTTRRILATAAAAGVLSVATALPAGAEPDPGYPGSTGVSATTQDGPQTVIRQVLVDDNALEYLQLGLGALAGIGVAGAAMAGVRRVGHRAPHPA